MGILFNTNTWRAPLRLIDCWLPVPSARRTAAANEPLATRAVQRFARAGWLGHQTRPLTNSQATPTRHADRPSTCGVRVVRQAESSHTGSGGVRLVISGRISDVCAELDRLADQESHASARAA